MELKFRIAEKKDISQIQYVRNSVKENQLSDPSVVTQEDVWEFISNRGKGWVCEVHSKVVGFSIVDLKENNVWALFIHPDYEGKGIGNQLHNMMVDWFFEQKKDKLWLWTSPETRAEGFYKKKGWKEVGKHGDDEIKFEMTFEDWEKQKMR